MVGQAGLLLDDVTGGRDKTRDTCPGARPGAARGAGEGRQGACGSRFEMGLLSRRLDAWRDDLLGR